MLKELSNSEWRKLMIEILKLPVELEPVSVVALGVPDEEKESIERWEPDKVHYEIW